MLNLDLKKKNSISAKYLPSIKTIILNTEQFDPDWDEDIRVFLHEYTHAVDRVESLTDVFESDYEEFIKKMYIKTKDSRFTDPTTSSHRLEEKEYYGSIYDKEVKELGYMGLSTYSVHSVKEFVCDIMAYYIMNKKVYPSMINKCKQIEIDCYN